MLNFVYRVIKALVIIAGLHLVVWGKSKDYKSGSLTTHKRKAAHFEQMIEASNNNDEETNKVITIIGSPEEDKEIDKTIVC